MPSRLRLPSRLRSSQGPNLVQSRLGIPNNCLGLRLGELRKLPTLDQQQAGATSQSIRARQENAYAKILSEKRTARELALLFSDLMAGQVSEAEAREQFSKQLQSSNAELSGSRATVLRVIDDITCLIIVSLVACVSVVFTLLNLQHTVLPEVSVLCD